VLDALTSRGGTRRSGDLPELTLTGYPPEDLLLAQGFLEANERALQRVAAASRQCAAVVGFVESDRDLSTRRVVAGGALHGVWRKEQLRTTAFLTNGGGSSRRRSDAAVSYRWRAHRHHDL